MGTLIIASDGEQARDYAARLLAVADHPDQVRTTTEIGDGAIGFDVPDELADMAGFGPAAAEDKPVTEVVPDEVPPPDPDEPAVVAEEAPPRNASRAIWAAWLDHKEIEYPADAGRDDLVALWDSPAK